MNEHITIQQDSSAWQFFARLSFGVSLLATTLGIYYMPLDIWIKGYLAMGLYFTVASAFTLSKTMRDEHEASKLVKKLGEAKTEKMLLKEYSAQS
jgi:hypothetical protein